MKVDILATFTGFPDGPAGKEKTFFAGTVAEVSDEFGKLIVGKGLARPLALKDHKHHAKGVSSE